MFHYYLYLLSLCNALPFFPKYSDTWIADNVLCTPQTADCMKGICTQCSDGSRLLFAFPIPGADDDADMVEYLRWETGQDKHLHRVSVIKTQEDACEV